MVPEKHSRYDSFMFTNDLQKSLIVVLVKPPLAIVRGHFEISWWYMARNVHLNVLAKAEMIVVAINHCSANCSDERPEPND